MPLAQGMTLYHREIPDGSSPCTARELKLRATSMQRADSMDACATLRSEPGSFRDRNGRVFYSGTAVFRGLSNEALKQWQILSATKFFRSFMRDGKLVRTEEVDPAGTLDSTETGQWAGLLRHETIPFISYPYEWSFGMLKDAALLQLELVRAALDEDWILKDASAFNLQWVGTRPVFIDIISFERLGVGEPWVGYRQFCQLFLYPLLLQVYKDIPFQPWLRGSIEGIEPEHCANLMSVRDLLRPGVLTHVHLQAKLQARFATTKADIRRELRTGGFNKELIKANVSRVTKLVQRLQWNPGKSQWSDYANKHNYTDSDHALKAAFVRNVVGLRPWRLVWDLGCNTGSFSRIAAENARYVVAMDADQLAVDRLYHSLKSERHSTILPLLINVADPSPNLGWRGLERKALPERGKPDLALCLALIHHLVISANIPVKEFVDWLAGLGSALIIEFVTKQDPMVQQLLRNKRDDYVDYSVEAFETCLADAFTIERRTMLASGTRLLYFGTPKL